MGRGDHIPWQVAILVLAVPGLDVWLYSDFARVMLGPQVSCINCECSHDLNGDLHLDLRDAAVWQREITVTPGPVKAWAIVKETEE